MPPARVSNPGAGSRCGGWTALRAFAVAGTGHRVADQNAGDGGSIVAMTFWRAES
jgi:hypothetical protein